MQQCSKLKLQECHTFGVFLLEEYFLSTIIRHDSILLSCILSSQSIHEISGWWDITLNKKEKHHSGHFEYPYRVKT